MPVARMPKAQSIGKGANFDSVLVFTKSFRVMSVGSLTSVLQGPTLFSKIVTISFSECSVGL